MEHGCATQVGQLLPANRAGSLYFVHGTNGVARPADLLSRLSVLRLIRQSGGLGLLSAQLPRLRSAKQEGTLYHSDRLRLTLFGASMPACQPRQSDIVTLGRSRAPYSRAICAVTREPQRVNVVSGSDWEPWNQGGGSLVGVLLCYPWLFVNDEDLFARATPCDM